MKTVILEPVKNNTVLLDEITDEFIVGIHFYNLDTKGIILKHPTKDGFHCNNLKKSYSDSNHWVCKTVKDVVIKANEQSIKTVVVFENYINAFNWVNT